MILRTQGVPAIYVTHYEDDVYALADSVVVLRNGRIENAGRLEEILSSNPHHLFQRSWKEATT